MVLCARNRGKMNQKDNEGVLFLVPDVGETIRWRNGKGKSRQYHKDNYKIKIFVNGEDSKYIIDLIRESYLRTCLHQTINIK